MNRLQEISTITNPEATDVPPKCDLSVSLIGAFASGRVGTVDFIGGSPSGFGHGFGRSGAAHTIIPPCEALYDALTPWSINCLSRESDFLQVCAKNMQSSGSFDWASL